LGPDPDKIDEFLNSLVEGHELPRAAANRLRFFILNGCCPLPSKIDDALEAVRIATGKLKFLDAKAKPDPRRLKRYDDVAKSLKSLQSLVEAMRTIGIGPLNDNVNKASMQSCRPLFICLDLGIRQRRKHFNGLLYFQAFVIPDPFMDRSVTGRSTEASDSAWLKSGYGSRVAEGGRYDDLVSACSGTSSLFP
jgi:hypothetical protein